MSDYTDHPLGYRASVTERFARKSKTYKLPPAAVAFRALSIPPEMARFPVADTEMTSFDIATPEPTAQFKTRQPAHEAPALTYTPSAARGIVTHQLSRPRLNHADISVLIGPERDRARHGTAGRVSNPNTLTVIDNQDVESQSYHTSIASRKRRCKVLTHKIAIIALIILATVSISVAIWALVDGSKNNHNRAEKERNGETRELHGVQDTFRA